MERLRGDALLWRRSLRDVDDDTHSVALARARDSLAFSLSVPDRGGAWGAGQGRGWAEVGGAGTGCRTQVGWGGAGEHYKATKKVGEGMVIVIRNQGH